MNLEAIATPQLLDLMRRMTVPVVLVDAEQRVIGWNPAAEEILEIVPGLASRAHCRTVTRCVSCIAGPCPAEGADKAEEVVSVRHRDGSLAKFLRKTTVLRDPLGGVRVIIEMFEPTVANENVASFGGICTAAPRMAEVLRRLRAVARLSTSVHLRGESGTGKRMLATRIHAESRRTGGAVSVPCLDGGAPDWSGLLVRAEGGTLILDGVERLSPQSQAHLLAQLRLSPNVRLVSIANRRMEGEVEAGRFDEALFLRMSGLVIDLPPLRARAEDLPLLAEGMLVRISAMGTRRVQPLGAEFLRALTAHHWPGNLWELENAITHAYAAGTGPELRVSDLPPGLVPGMSVSAAPSGPRDKGERLQWALVQSRGHVGRAAALLGISRSTFWRMRRQLGVGP